MGIEMLVKMTFSSALIVALLSLSEASRQKVGVSPVEVLLIKSDFLETRRRTHPGPHLRRAGPGGGLQLHPGEHRGRVQLRGARVSAA